MTKKERLELRAKRLLQKRKFAMLPAGAIGDNRLSATDFRVLNSIALMIGSNNWCWPSRALLAVICGLDAEKGLRSISRSLSKLEECGYIIKRATVGKDGASNVNRYQVIYDKPNEEPIQIHDDLDDEFDDEFDVTPCQGEGDTRDRGWMTHVSPLELDNKNYINTAARAHAREEIHTANFQNLRSDESVPVNVKESSCHAKTQPHSLDYGKSGDVFEEDCEGRSGRPCNNLTPPTQSVNSSQTVNTSNSRRKNFTHQGENSPLDELYQVGVNEMIPTAWFNIATRKNIPTDKVNDVFGKFKHFYRGREYTKIDWNEKWNRWCDNERQFKDTACQEEKPIEVVVDHSESAEVKRVRQEILRIVGDATYKSWYASCEIKLSSTNIEIIAPTKFNMTWIETNGKNLDSPLRASLGKNVVYKHKQQNTSREARMAS